MCTYLMLQCIRQSYLPPQAQKRRFLIYSAVVLSIFLFPAIFLLIAYFSTYFTFYKILMIVCFAWTGVELITAIIIYTQYNFNSPGDLVVMNNGMLYEQQLPNDEGAAYINAYNGNNVIAGSRNQGGAPVIVNSSFRPFTGRAQLIS